MQGSGRSRIRSGVEPRKEVTLDLAWRGGHIRGVTAAAVSFTVRQEAELLHGPARQSSDDCGWPGRDRAHLWDEVAPVAKPKVTLSCQLLTLTAARMGISWPAEKDGAEPIGTK